MRKRAEGPKAKLSSSHSDRDIIEPFFDGSYYLAAQADVRDAKVDPLAHYVAIGWQENRDPCAWFSGSGYLDLHPDVRASGMNPFVHYIKAGRQEGRAIVPPRATAGAATAASDHQPARAIHGKGLRGTLEYRGRLGNRLACIAGWAVSDAGLPMRVAGLAVREKAECLGFMQVRQDVGAARTDVGFCVLLAGDLDDGDIRIELVEACAEAPLRVEVVVDLPELEAKALVSAVTEAIDLCQPVDDRVLPATVRHLAALHAATDGRRLESIADLIDRRAPKRQALKVLLIARHDPRACYLNLVLLAARVRVPADFILVNLGEVAQQFAATHVRGFGLVSGQTLTLIDGPDDAASGGIIGQVLSLAAAQDVAFLCVLDDVAIAPALDDIAVAAQAAVSAAGARDVHAWLTQTRWPDDVRSSSGAPAPFGYQQVFPDAARPVGVLVAGPAAARTLSSTRPPAYPGRGWTLTGLASSASGAHVSRVAVVDVRKPSAKEDALCALFATYAGSDARPGSVSA